MVGRSADMCPRCFSKEGFIRQEKAGIQLSLSGNVAEHIMKKKANPVCASCGKWSSKTTIKNQFKEVVEVEVNNTKQTVVKTSEQTISQMITGAEKINDRGGEVTIRNGHPVVGRPLQLGNNNNTRCPDCGMENSVLENNGRETCLKCGEDVTGRVEVITWVR